MSRKEFHLDDGGDLKRKVKAMRYVHCEIVVVTALSIYVPQ